MQGRHLIDLSCLNICLVLKHSPYGAGQDPWLYAVFLALVVYLIGLHRFEKGNGVAKTSIGFTIYDEPVWGRGCIGGGLAVSFLSYFGMRFVFAFAPFEVSRNVNVGTVGFFMLSMFFTTLGFTNCWWKTQINRQKEEHGDDSVRDESPGIYRKTLLLLGCSFESGASHIIIVGLELLFMAVAACYCIIALPWSSSFTKRRRNPQSQHLCYLCACVPMLRHFVHR
jgi:hypothetical protein